MNKKKLDVHFVQHTHWDREWYFTSDDSRTMLYYDMKFLIEYLEKNDDKFTFDGQSSVIDDFLKFAPEWKERFSNVVKAGKLLVGPYYTQTDETLPHGESIMRNIEIGNEIAKKIGHSMQVGYVPDVFGHNNQMPQILHMNGINNISFYRGLDPELTNDKTYFNYVSPDGTKVLGHWQTHYSTNGGAFEYTTKAFEEHVVADYTEPGKFGPSVKSYAKRNLGLPVGVPIGSDQKPFRKEVKEIISDLNKKYSEFNFIASDYETLLKEVVKQIKEDKIQLSTVTTELRAALTGRVHRTVTSSRMDIKQKLFKLEDTLINVLEPLSVMCLINNIDVPWKMIEYVWKEVFKSSAHDSYGCTNEDHVNAKIKHRLINAQRVADGVVAMLSRIYSQKLVDEYKDYYEKMVVFNFKPTKYSGLYEINTTVKRKHDAGMFRIFDGKKEIKYSILKRDNLGTHERDALRLLINVADVPAFGTKTLSIKYYDETQYALDTKNKIDNGQISVQVLDGKLMIKKGEESYKNLFRLAMDPSVGDTYDHSPITHHDKKYILDKFTVIERNEEANTIKFRAEAMVPSTISKWEKDEVTTKQDATVQITLIGDKLHIKVFVTNKSLNGRMILLVDAQTNKETWYHDQQYGIYNRELHTKYMAEWEQPNSLGYKWDEYPTNLSPMQSFVSNEEKTLTVYVKGSREHEMIEFEGKKEFAITMYRALDMFGRSRFLYRPGRGSGAKCEGPECQMLGDELEFTFVIDVNKTNVSEQFEFTRQLDEKNFYIPGQWGLERTILRWQTNTEYYDNDKSNRKAKLELPKFATAKGMQVQAIYKDIKGRTIVRLLNTSKEKEIDPEGFKISRTLEKFSTKATKLPQWGLINILIK